MLVQIGQAFQAVEEAAPNVRRMRALIAGARALLSRPDYFQHANDDGAALRELLLEAEAIADGVVVTLDSVEPEPSAAPLARASSRKGRR